MSMHNSYDPVICSGLTKDDLTEKSRRPRVSQYHRLSISDENKVIRIAKCDVFSGVCESIR